jgi:glycosyltransferase involved in cell wall biosynthesis
MPFFSICIPNYNYSKYLKLTIESVLSQSFTDFEIIISDNASKDDSVEMVKSFKDSRITLIENQVNLGFSPNLDKCTQNASGEFMILLSSDDVMFVEALETIYQVIKSNKQEDIVIMSACSVIDSKGNKIGSKRAMTGDVYSYIKKNQVFSLEANPNLSYENYSAKTVLTALLSGTFQPAGQFLATCYSSRLYKKLDGYRSIMAVHPDAHFSHRMLFQNPIVCYLDKELFGYRVHEANNLTATLNLTNIKYLLDSYLFTQIYDDQSLNKFGLNTNILKEAFINRIILHDAIWATIRGRNLKGLRILLFGLSAYPWVVFRSVNFLFFFLLFPISPIFWFFSGINKFQKNH